MGSAPDFERAQNAVFDEVGITPASQFIDIDDLQTRVHVITHQGDERDGVPMLFLHSGGTFGALYAPLLAELDETWTMAIDRPGFGLSGEFEYSPATYRETIVETLTGILDEMEIDRVDLAGNSNGGYWSIVFALSRPERVRQLILLGSLPTLPGTNSPLPLRLYTIPVVNQLIRGMMLATDEQDVIDKYDIFGEGETIQKYPALIQTIIARDSQPHAHDLDISEMKSLLTVRGWRASNQLRAAELRALRHPTVAIWGEDDPLGGPEDVRETIEEIPNVRLKPLEAGHVPWLGYPEKCADFIREMRR